MISAELRRSLEGYARRLDYKPATTTQQKLLCTCHVRRAMDQGSRFAVDLTHTESCFYTEYFRGVMARSHSRGLTRVGALNTGKGGHFGT